jgi:nucleoside-diphosphate kinase
MLETTLILIKPDATKHDMVGQILGYFEHYGLKIVKIRSLDHAPVALLDLHYQEHKGKEFYRGLISFMLSGRMIAVVLEGKCAVHKARKIIGSAQPSEAHWGTIRYDLGWVKLRHTCPKNLVHASDSPAAAIREMALWFPADE